MERRQEMRSLKKRRRRVRNRIGWPIMLLLCLLVFAACVGAWKADGTSVRENEKKDVAEDVPDDEPENVSEETAQLSILDYPEELLELLRKNPETKEFVLQYPKKKDTFSRKDLKELSGDEVPLLMQWDDRWGYYPYGDNVMGLTGCGPTSLSMVASFLLQDPSLTPLFMADYAIRKGYCVPGSGTSWEFMSKGAAGLGLRVQEVPLSEGRVKEYLSGGHPIICIMGPGEFTDTGHFIVLTGLQNGRIRMNDSNSRAHSGKLWEFDEIKGQIRNMWVYFKK